MAATSGHAEVDRAFERFKDFVRESATYLENHFSEADTRVKFIDPLLTDVLGWDEHTHIRREENHTDVDERHCIDYVLSYNTPILVVEAKRLLKRFETGSKSKQLLYSLSGVIQQWPNAWSAIRQARQYCDQVGARYALVTNGSQFIAFRAITDGGPWTDGKAVVFRSLDVVEKNFTLFHECLSRAFCSRGRLSEVARREEAELFRERPRAAVTCATTGFRNTLHDVLYQAFREVFLDNADPSPEFLEQCYCTNSDVLKFGRQLDSLLIDPLPSFRTPVHPAKPGDKKDPFEKTVQSLGKSGTDPLVVVMGGDGVGKTTFLQWYFRAHLDRKARQSTVVVTCDYRSIECGVEELHRRTLRELVRGLHNQAATLLTGFEQLKVVFEEPIKRATEGTLKPFVGDREELEKRVAQLIDSLQTEDEEHLAYLVRYLRGRCGRQVTLILDNIDQKKDLFQEKLYHTAQALAHSSGATVILSLREATYQRLMRRPEFNAFTSIDFHVKAQPLGAILEKRLAYLAERFSGESFSFRSSGGAELTVEDLEKFLRLMTRSLLPQERSSQSTECLSAISNGNARLQLQLIYTFLVSGQTKVDEYFWSYSKSETRKVPFHEFLHSIILDDRRVFEEDTGRAFMNVFEPGGSAVASHFTALRILEFFRTGLGQTGLLRAADFVPLERISLEFEGQGLSAQDIAFHVRRMVEFRLLLPQGLAASEDAGIEPVAITKCGVYYLDVLYRDLTYYSLMAHDATLLDEGVCRGIGESLARYSLESKLPIFARNEMARRFVGYLESLENRELNDGAVGKHPVFGKLEFVRRMRQDLERVERELG